MALDFERKGRKMKKFFEVVKNVVKELSWVILMILLGFVSLGLSGFVIIEVLPQIIRITGTILIVFGALMLILGLIIGIAYTIHKASVAYSYAKANNISVDEAWKEIDSILGFLDT